MSVDGIFNILKPPGRTSFDVVSRIRRLSGEHRVGHTGTLDPDATGVLVVCLGQGTRVIEFLSKAEKTYRADIELGVTTDTDDASGHVLNTRDIGEVTEQKLRGAIDSFRGGYNQVPPVYSALKQQGKRLYEFARQGIEVSRKPRKVQIFRIALLSWRPPLMAIEVDCGSGTYIRALARDIGELLGVGAHLRTLVRLKAEPFSIGEATDLILLEEAFAEGWWPSLLYPIDEVMLKWKAVVLSREEESRVQNGGSVALLGGAGSDTARLCRAYSASGQFLAVLSRADAGVWRPRKVFRRPVEEV